MEKSKEEHRQQLEDVRRAEESSGFVSSVTFVVNSRVQNDVMKLTHSSAGVPTISAAFSRAWRR